MRIAIAGYGVEGEASYRYWHASGHDVTILDDNKVTAKTLPLGAKVLVGERALDSLASYDMVVRTAGMPPGRLTGATKVWSATNEFFSKCPAPIIGVTGTKGKGTTCSLIYSILQAAGKTSWLVGNIGTPALDVLGKVSAGDVVVYELSSFQLWDIEYSPHVAVVLGIDQDHLDVHAGLADYLQAKARIVAKQSSSDTVIYNHQSQQAKKIATNSKAKQIPYPSIGHAHLKNGSFCYSEQLICSIDNLQLVGKHNIENTCGAISAAWLWTKDSNVITEGIRNFQGLPHRLEKVRQREGVTYYNDSFSSAPSSTIAALQSFDQPEIIMMGGLDRGVDFSGLAEAVSKQPNIKRVVLYGQAKDRLARSFKTAGFDNFVVETSSNFDEVVNRSFQLAEEGDVVLFSPACASFDMFKNFHERGDVFKEIVMGLQ